MIDPSLDETFFELHFKLKYISLPASLRACSRNSQPHLKLWFDLTSHWFAWHKLEIWLSPDCSGCHCFID